MRYFLILFTVCSFLFAGMDVKGLITSIDHSKKTITINNNITIQVLPQTEIKLDDCGMFGNDIYGKFTDLKVNSFVDVDVFMMGNQMSASPQNQADSLSYIAEEIELQCHRNRAY